MINKTIHFFYLMDDDLPATPYCSEVGNYSSRPFSFFHKLNIFSAKLFNPNYTINLYYNRDPQSQFFDELDGVCNKIQIEDQNIPKTAVTKNIAYISHVVSLLKFQKLYQEGGVCLDLDVVCVKSFDDLMNFNCVMGQEYSYGIPEEEQEKYIGLSNATILAEKESLFLQECAEKFIAYYKKEYNYNSVSMPDEIAKLNPEHINIQPRSSFFKFSWDRFGYDSLFQKNENIEDCYSIHLWQSLYFDTLSLFDASFSNEIWQRNCTLSNLYKLIHQQF